MKRAMAARAAMVRMKVVFRESLLRAWVDSTVPIGMPASSTASGAAAHQCGQRAEHTALAASVASAALFSQLPV